MMTNRTGKLLMIAGVSLLIAAPYTSAFARDDSDHGRGRDNDRHGREVVVVGHDRYHYRDGRFYRPGWFGFDFVISTPPFGAIVTTLPHSSRTVVVTGDSSYYYYDGIYYRACPGGYAVVPAPGTLPPAEVLPAVVQPVAPVVRPQASDPGYVVIHVPNANGSFTPVTLIRQGNGYIGPQGEYYGGNPTVDQLRALYGK